MKTPTLFNALIYVSALTVGAAAFAQSTSVPAPVAALAAVATQPAPQRPLSLRDIYDAVEKQGYRNITEIERDDHRYEVKADNAEGQRVKLRVDADTGKIDSVRLKK